MKKKVFGRKLGRERDTRRALFRSLIKELILHGKIVTTRNKAKAIIPDIDKLVKLAKSKELSSIRRVYSYLGNDRKSIDTLISNMGKMFEKRKSGFTTFVNLPRRKGDFAEMVRLEWSEKIEVSTTGSKSRKGSKGKDEKSANTESTVKNQKAQSKKISLKERLESLRKKKSV